jgi:hypothetical protein
VTKIAEAYFHLDPYDVSEEGLERYGQEVADIAADSATGLFDPNCEIEVRLKIGTLTGWALVVGAIGGVLKYKALKENLIEMVDDGRKYGGRVINRFLHKKKIPSGKVFRTERRTKTPGRLLRIVKRQDRLNDNRDRLSKEDVKREMDAIERLILKALEDFPAEDRPIVRAALDSRQTGSQSKYNRKPPPPHRRIREDSYQQRELFGADDVEEDHAADDNEHGEFRVRFRLGDWRPRKPDPP